jgi:hypothetical protein
MISDMRLKIKPAAGLCLRIDVPNYNETEVKTGVIR